MIVIGCDNGLDGGVVALRGDGTVLLKMVTPTLGVVGKGKREFDDAAMHRMLNDIVTHAEEARVALPIVFQEKAQAMPGQGVSSMFSVGKGYGLWRGICVGLGLPREEVHPRTWQAVMLAGLDKTDTKRASAIAAIRYQPSVDWRATPRCKKPHDGLTDAYCIAEYGRRQLVKRGVAV
jgi:hypothetical protein